MPTCTRIFKEYEGSDGKPKNLNKDGSDADIKKGGADGSGLDAVIGELVTNLPEGTGITGGSHTDWQRAGYLRLEADCELELTFLQNKSGSGKETAISYFTFNPENPPASYDDLDDIKLALANCSSAAVSQGDTMKLAYSMNVTTDGDGKRWQDGGVNYTFPQNTAVGFIVHTDQWDSTAGEVSIGSEMYFSNPVLNDEDEEAKRTHGISFRSQEQADMIVFGFADQKRTGAGAGSFDHDFRDICFGVTPSDITAVEEECYNSLSKQTFGGTILCEDLRDGGADMDFDDLVLEYKVTEHLRNSKVQSINFLMKVTARGAWREHSFGVKIPNVGSLVDSHNALVFREEWCAETSKNKISHLTAAVEAKEGTSEEDRIPLIASTKELCPPGTDWASNTFDNEAETDISVSRTTVVFGEGGVTRSDIGGAVFPYNFYLEVYKTDGSAVEWTNFSDETYAPSTAAAAAGLAAEKRIYVLPGKRRFRFPKEKEALRSSYPHYLTYLNGDLSYMEWYQNGMGEAAKVRVPPSFSDGNNWRAHTSRDNAAVYGDVTMIPWGDEIDWNGAGWGHQNSDDANWAIDYNWVESKSANRDYLLAQHSLDDSFLVDWDDITNGGADLQNAVLDAIYNFGMCNVRKSGDYSLNGAENKTYMLGSTEQAQTTNALPLETITVGSRTLQLCKSKVKAWALVWATKPV